MAADDDGVALLERVLDAARAKRAGLLRELHPGWIAALWRRVGLPEDAAPSDAALAAALTAVYALRWPSLARLRGRAHRIALLPRAELLRVLAAVTLHAARDRVRRSLDKAERAAMVAVVGEQTYLRLLTLPARGAAGPELGRFAAVDLALQGHALLRAGGHWRCRDCLAWVRLALPPGPARKGADLDPAADATVLADLPDLFPEHAWLFGSPMDRTLSASPGGVIRAADFAVLTTAAAVAATLDAERERVLALARAEADALVSDARALLAEAARRHERARAEGRERGLQEAAVEWTQKVLDEAAVKQRDLRRQVERLSSIVATAVERMVDEEDRAALIRRSLRTISKLVQDTSLLTLRVCPVDRDNAQRAVDEVQPQLGGTLSIDVVADASLPAGACLFESDRGVIDAGVQTQLAAIRRAVTRAVESVARDPADTDAAPGLELSDAPAHAPEADVDDGDDDFARHDDERDWQTEERTETTR